MRYTAQDFDSDMKMMGEVNSTEWDVVPGPLPEYDEHIEYSPQAKPFVRILSYFTERYGEDEGADKAYRFMTTVGFLKNHREELVREGAAKPPPQDDEIAVQFIDFFLEGFVDPTPPVLFATHRDANQSGEISFRKVLKRYKQQRKAG